MGYYTEYELTVSKNGMTNYNIIKEFVATVDGAGYALEGDGYCAGSTKWYSHEEDLKKFSKKYPKHLFTLTGVGEGSSYGIDELDIWKKYCKDGKIYMERAEVRFDGFKALKLK